MKKLIVLLGIIIALTTISCKKNDPAISKQKNTIVKKASVRKAPKAVSYTFENTIKWLKKNESTANLDIAIAVNRTDRENFVKIDSVIIPKDLSGDLAFYLPFPLEASYLKNVTKIIFFSYPTQTFAAYENGILTYTGPTNMGKAKAKTPTGLFFTNWKAEETISTVDDEWKLLWNFNIENKEGIGFHQYSLPGYPASHSCLRLQEKDAKYLYEWADQWVLADEENVKFKGTPVIVFGSYPFDAPKPWLQLVENPNALTISADEIEKITNPFLATILTEQRKRTKS
jgi:lipoprotein-anchoring transpeptidase ErfK/SrfK